MDTDLKLKLGKILAHGINESFTPELFDFVYDEATRRVRIIIKATETKYIHDEKIGQSFDNALSKIAEILNENDLSYGGVLQNPKEVSYESL